MKQVIQSIRYFLEEESAPSLIVVSILVLALEITNELGMWSLPWFQNNIADITLILLALLSLGVAAQLRITNSRLRNLANSALEERGLMTKLKQIGITDLWVQGNDKNGVEKWREVRKRAKKLSLISISAFHYAYGEKSNLKNLLLAEGCHIRILVAKPDSELVARREALEGKHRIGGITKEIHLTVGLFIDLVEEIKERMTGSIEIRFCKYGDIPARVEIVNDTFVHWTPHILPARAVEIPAFELVSGNGTLVPTLLIGYFEAFWRESEQEVAYKWPRD